MLHKYAGKLTDEQKIYVVTRLASYIPAAAIVRDLKEIFGIEVTRQAIDCYHPERPSGAGLSQRFKDVFREVRKAYIAAALETASRLAPVRIRLREDMMLEAWDGGDYKTANVLLDSIAKEAGGAFESSHKQPHFGFGGIQPTAIVTVTGPSEPVPEVLRDDAEPDAPSIAPGRRPGRE
jgi:hypothetical protein